MTLDALANEIAAQAKAEAESIIATAKQQAKQIEDDAKAEADIFLLMYNHVQKEKVHNCL